MQYKKSAKMQEWLAPLYTFQHLTLQAQCRASFNNNT